MLSNYIEGFEAGQKDFHDGKPTNPYNPQTESSKHSGWNDGYESCTLQPVKGIYAMGFLLAVILVAMGILYMLWRLF